MNYFIGILVSLLIGYLLGSISNGVIIGKVFFNVDVRTMGSHNAGGTNTGRVLGKKFGLLTIILDMLKTIVAMWLVLFITRINAIESYIQIDPSYLAYIAGIGACFGHTFPLFFNFKGGKAVACFSGIIIATNWIILLVGLIVFFATLIISKYVSLSSMFAACSLAIGSYIIFFTTHGMLFNMTGDIYYSIFMTFVALFVVVRHHTNIKRLIKGTESKISWLSKKKVEN